MTNSIPNINPANSGTLVGAFTTALRDTLKNSENALPAKIVSYDRDANRASVQPMIAMLRTDGVGVSRAQITNIPVYQIGGGGFILSFPLNQGDLGWIIACDRDISLFAQSYLEKVPNTMRLHDFGDSFFLPDPMTGYTISGEDDQNAVLQSLDGSVKISLSADSVKLQTPVNVTIESPQIDLIGNVSIDGDLDVEGSIDATDDISTDSDINADVDINAEGKCTIQDDIASGGDITAAGSITPNTPIPP